MLKKLLYLGVACLGLGFVEGDKFNKRIENVVEGFPVIEHELNDKPLIQRGSLFIPVEINVVRGRGIYKGPDGFYYHVRYNLFDDSVYVEEVSRGGREIY